MATLNSALQRIKKIESLHQIIRSADIDTIKQLSIEDHDSMNGYILKGKSPLTVALEVKKFGTFLYLLSRGLPLDEECIEVLRKLSETEKKEIGSDSILLDVLRAREFKAFAQLQSFGIPLNENCRLLLDSLSDSEKMEIRNYNLLFANNLSNAHVLYILSIVKECFGANTIDEKKSAAIERLFVSLNDIESIRPLLKAVKDIGQLEIIFDCNNDTIQCMMPSSAAVGYTIVQRKKILIAAKGHYNENYDFVFDNETNAKGTIIHEITHFVMENMYDNDGKPYYRIDKERRKRFKQITAQLKFRYDVAQHLDPTIKNIFDLYKEENYESELIARASELIVKHSQDKEELELVREYAGSLFRFFDETLKHVDSFNKSKWSIRELNRSFKVCEKLLKSEISFTSSIDKIKISNGVKVITSNAPLFCMAQILNDLRASFKFDVDACVIFSNFESLWEKPWDVINAFYSSDETVLVVNCENTSNEDIVNLVSSLEGVHINRRTVLVTGKELGNKSQREKVEIELRKYEWDDLDHSTKELLLDKSVDFQNENEKIKLSEIIATTSEACKFLPLQATFTNQLKVDKSLDTSHEDFCLPRDFQIGRKQVKDGKSILIWEDIKHEELLCMKNLGKLLISDIAGTGKTVMIERIAKDLKKYNPAFWVNLFDLKNYTNELKQVKKTSVTSNFLGLMEKVFKRDISDLDRVILKEHYNEGKLIVLLDSFDEISPYYKNIAKIFIEKFESRKGNQLWVSTRPHLENELKKSFGFTVVKLKELTREDQVRFLMQSWRKTDKGTKKKAVKLIDRLQKLIRSGSGYIGYPLLVKMIAEIHSDVDPKVEENFSYFSIYDNFWKKHISNWGARSKIAKLEQDELISGETQQCSKVHQILALKGIFGCKFDTADFQVDEEWTDERILRVGIVKSMDNFQFIHQTFAEYFVVVFIRNSLTSSRSRNLKIAVQLIKTVVLEYGHRIIRSFLNECLKNATVTDQARKKIETMIRDLNYGDCYNFMWYVQREDLDVVLDFLQLHSLEPKTIKNLWRGNNYNLAYESFLSNRGPFVRCLVKSLEVLTNEDQKRLLGLQKHEGNIYHRLLRNPNGLDPDVLKYLESVFSEVEIKAMLLESKGLMCPVKNETSENSLVKNACSLFKKYLDYYQMKKCLFGDSTSNCLASAAMDGRKHGINSVFEFAEEVFGKNIDEFRTILKSSNFYGRTLLILNLERNYHGCSYESLRENLSKSLSDEEINRLITEAKTQTLIDCLVHSRRIEKALSIISSLLPKKKQLSLISECLKISIRDTSSEFGRFDIFARKYSELWEDSASTSTNEIKKIIMQAYEDRSYLIRRQFQTNMKKYFSFLEKYFNGEEIVQLLLTRDNQGENVVNSIARLFSSEEIETFFEIIMQRFSLKLSRKLLLSFDAHGNSVFHASTGKWKDSKAFSTMLRLMKDRFGVEDVKKLFLSTNNRNKSVFGKIFQDFFEVEEQLSEVLDPDEVRNLLEHQATCDKRAFLDLITKGNKTFDVKFSILKKYFTSEELVEFMLQRHDGRRKVIISVFIRSSASKFENFFESTKSFGRELSLKLFSAVDGKGDNVFHASVLNDGAEEFSTVLRLMKERLGDTEVRKLLLMNNSDGYSVLHRLLAQKLHFGETLRKTDESNVNKCLEIMSKLISTEELKQMLFRKNIFGNSCIDKIRRSNFQSTFEKLRELGIEPDNVEL